MSNIGEEGEIFVAFSKYLNFMTFRNKKKIAGNSVNDGTIAWLPFNPLKVQLTKFAVLETFFVVILLYQNTI